MSMNAKKMGGGKSNDYGDTPPLESGSYPARTAQVIGMGVQPQRPWEGQEKPPAMEVMITYEFADEFMLDKEGNELEDRPRWLSETLPLRSLDSDRANSTKRYYALDPTEEFEGDFTKLIDIPCMVTVVQNRGKSRKGEEKIYENIASVSTMRDKDKKKAVDLKNPPKVFNPYEPDMEIFKSLPDWIQEKIKGAIDHDPVLFKKAEAKLPSNDDGESEVPEDIEAESVNEEGPSEEDTDDGDDW